MSTYYSPKISTDGLVVYVDAANSKSYPGTGDTWYDLSGNGNNASRTNNGGYGGQVTFNSSGFFDYTVNSPASTAGATAGNGFAFSNVIVPTTNGFSIMSVVKRNSSVKAFGDRETIFSNAGGGDGWRFGIDSGGNLYYLIGGISNVGYQEGNLGGSGLIDNQWHVVGAVFDRAAVRGSYTVYGYIDGARVGNVTISAGAGGNVAFTATAGGIGYLGCCDVFAGYIALLGAYNQVLTDSDMRQNFDALKGRFGIL